MAPIAAFQLRLSLDIDLAPIDAAGSLLAIEGQEALVGLGHIDIDIVEEIVEKLVVDAGIQRERMSMTVIDIAIFDMDDTRVEVNRIGNVEMGPDEIVGETSVEVGMARELEVVHVAEEPYGTGDVSRKLLEDAARPVVDEAQGQMVGIDAQVHRVVLGELQIEFGMGMIDGIGHDICGDGDKLAGNLDLGRKMRVAEQRVDIGKVLNE